LGFLFYRPSFQPLDLRNRSLHRQKRIVTLCRAIVGDPKLTTDSLKIDLIDGFNDQSQTASIRFPLFV
jgi:hypothetical protein